MKRSKPITFFSFLLLCIVLVFTNACKKDEPEKPKITAEQIQAIKTGFGQISPILDSALLTVNPLAVFQSVLPAIKTKTAVEDAWVDSTTFYVKFEHGGMIMWSIMPGIDTTFKSIHKSMQLKSSNGNPVLVGNRDALLLNQQYHDENRPYCREVIEAIYDSLSNKGFSVTVRNGEEANLEYIKNHMSDFGTIFYISHGIYDKEKDLTWIMTGENAGDLPIDSIIHDYYEQWVAGQLGIGYVKELISGEWQSVPLYTFSDKWVDAVFPDGIFPHSLIYLVACQGATDPSQDLEYILARKGAGSVIAWTETNCRGQVTGKVIFDYLIQGYTVSEVIDDLLTYQQRFDNCSGKQAGVDYWPAAGGDYCLFNNRASVSTYTVFQITATSATAGGRVNSAGTSPITEKGVCWNINPNPTLNDDHMSDGAGTGDIRCYLSGLTPNTTYYIRAYAKGQQVAYGEELTFTTLEGYPPTVTTTTPSTSNIYKTFAICGGNVTNAGGAPVTARGFCWSTNSNPTTNDNYLNVGSGTGGFWDTIPGLSASTLYYVRSFAINASGLSYGNEVQFTTKTYALGDSYGGGIIACFWHEMDPGYVAGEEHGIIVAPSDQSTGALWGCYGTGIPGTLPDNGAGPANTTAIVGNCAEQGIAARLCDDLTLNGFSDWFLPSSYELGSICNFKDVVGGFSSGLYWSSTNNFSSLAETINFQDNNCLRSDTDKRTPCYVRAARYF